MREGPATHEQEPRSGFELNTQKTFAMCKTADIKCLNCRGDPNLRNIPEKLLDGNAVKIHNEIVNHFDDGIAFCNRDHLQSRASDREGIENFNPRGEAKPWQRLATPKCVRTKMRKSRITTECD
jgi:hypothetical protein